MKIISIDRELNTDQNYMNYYYYCFKNLQKKFTKKRGIFWKKNCQKINTRNIFMNFEIQPLNHKFPKAFFLFTSIYYCNDPFHNRHYFTDIL